MTKLEAEGEKPLGQRVRKTVLVFSVVFMEGLCIYSFYCSLIDLSEVFGASIAQVSGGTSCRFCGICFGSVLAGFLYRKNDKLTMCGIFLFMEGFMPIIITRIKSLVAYFCFTFVIGFCNGIIKSGTVLTVTEIWKEKSGPFVQGIEFVETAAAIVVPLAVRPFLSERLNDVPLDVAEGATVLDDPTTVDFGSNSSVIVKGTETRVWLPLTSLGILMISIAVTTLFSRFLSGMRSTKRMRKCQARQSHELTDFGSTKVEKEKANAGRIYCFVVTLCCCIMMSSVQIVFVPFYMYWTPFVMSSTLDIPKATGLLMLSVFSASMTVSSFLGIPISMKFRPLNTLVLLIALLLIGNLLNLFFLHTSEILLWTGGILLALGYGCFFATVFNVIQERIIVTSFVGSLWVFSGYFSNACGMPILVGIYFKNEPLFLVYTALAAIALMFIMVTILFIFDCWKVRPYKQTVSITE